MPWQPTTIVFPDVELWAANFLRTALPAHGYTGTDAVRVSTAYTGQRLEVTVRRDGGPVNGERESARLGVNVYAKTDTDQAVSDLARVVSALLRGAATGEPVLRVSQMLGPSPIADAAARRRFMTFEIDVRGTAL